MIGTKIGSYEVVAKLGEGGMGVVYRASDSRLKRDVALKVLPAVVAGDAARLARFLREAELLASLNHPNIAHVHGLEESGGVTALVMELVEGDDLSLRIAAGPIPLMQALPIALQIASALEAAHEQGVIHRDLKPGNIKIRPDGTVKVLDFGLAKSLSQPDAAPTITALSSPGLVMGTPAYMSPEQARGEATGRETDVWAFAVVLYEMLTGISPFARPSAAETVARVLGAPVDESRLPPETPAGVRRLIRRCLERDFRRRWRHLGDARIEIEEALASPSETSNVAASGPGPVSRRRAIVYGAASLGLLAAGFGGRMWLDGRQRPDSLTSYRRLTFRRGLIRSARVAPDGQTILYGALWEDDLCRAHTVRIDGPESRALEGLPHANILAISRRGELALALGPHERGVVTYGMLATVPMAGGAPRDIVGDVKFADWSPDGNALAIIRQVDGRDRLEFPVGTPLVAPAVGEPFGLGFPRISPDGTHVAFLHYTAPLSLIGRVSIVDRAGTVKVLSAESRNVHGLAWRGHEILYTAADDRPLFRALHAVTPAGASRTIARLVSNITLWDVLPDGRLVLAQTDDRSVMIGRKGDRERDLSWLDASYVDDVSRDGRVVLFTEQGQGGGPDVSMYLRGVDGSAAVRLRSGRAVALSPDARHAICFPAGFAPATQLEIVPTGAGEGRRIDGHGLTFLGARWLPDGRIVVQAVEAGTRPRLYLHDLSSGRPKAITPEGIDSWAVSPEGSTIAARVAGAAIRLYGLDGSAPRDIPGLSSVESPIGWITGGLLVMRPTDPDSPFGQIYKIDVKTGRQEAWENILPRDRMGIMHFGRYRSSPDGKSQVYTWHRALSNLYLADGLT